MARSNPARRSPLTPLRTRLSRRLRDLGVEERAGPGRDDGFAALLYRGNAFAHFHTDNEIDIRLGKEIIRRERLIHPADSTVHPGRSRNSPWYEFRFRSPSDVDEALRLVELALSGLTVSHQKTRPNGVTRMKEPAKLNLRDGDHCEVVGGTHAGKSGTVSDLHSSKTGHVTITVVQKSGQRFKTLAKNVVARRGRRT